MDTHQPPQIMINGSADDCLSPKTRVLVDYWRERAGPNGALPRWSDFELMDLYAIAGGMAVKDVIGGGADFINRFWGTELTQVLGFEGTRKRVSTYQPVTMRETVFTRYRRIVSSAQSSMARGSISSMPGLEYVQFELVHLPLSGRTAGVAHIISVFDFGFQPPKPDA